MWSWFSGKKTNDAPSQGGPSSNASSSAMKDLFNFGGKVAYKKQAETRRPTDYDYLFKLLLVGDSGMPLYEKI